MVLLGARRIWSEIAQHEKLTYSVAVWSLSPSYIIPYLKYFLYKKWCIFSSLSNKLFYILIEASFLHLQCSKQTHFHHRTFCKLQKWWNIIHCTTINISYKNDFVNNHQEITIDSAVKIKDRFMSFPGIFHSPHNVNISQLNFKRPTVTTQWHCVQTSVYSDPVYRQVFTVTLCTDRCLQWHCVQTSVYSDTVYRQVFTVILCTDKCLPSYCSNRGGKVYI